MDNITRAENHLKTGQLDEAEALCQTILKADNQNAKALLIFGAVRVRQQKWPDAIDIFSKGARLHPDAPSFFSNLGRLYLQTNEYGKAIPPLQKAVVLKPEDVDLKKLLIQAYNAESEIEYSENARQAMLLCLRNPSLNHEWMAKAWIDLFWLTPAYAPLHKAFSSRTYEDFCNEASLGFFNFLQEDEFILLGLKRLLICNPLIEHGLMWSRRWLLERQGEPGISGLLSFLSVLGQYCFFNEYAFSVEDNETSLVDELAKKPDTEMRIALLSCYRPLHKLPQAQSFLQLLPNYTSEEYQELIRIQVQEPLTEEAIKLSIPYSGSIHNGVSLAVQNQYEENPYPRWKTIGVWSPREDVRKLATGRQILVAGCGTGREAVEAALLFPEARITAIDLSRSSLAHGIRKSQEMGITNIDFIQCDLLEIGGLRRKFDFIISSGVLVCIEEPLEGLKHLAQNLNACGQMKIALYSTRARDFIKWTRDFISKNDYPATAEGIRAFRSYVMQLPDEDPLKINLTSIKDFYSLSQCRDLLFHVKEHTFSALQIDHMLQQSGLALMHMNVRLPEHVKEFRKMFPDDPKGLDLHNWHKFEQAHPYAFAAMYHLWLCHADSKDRQQDLWLRAVLPF